MGIAEHFETGERLPEEVYLKLVAARTFRAGSLSLRQVSMNVFGWLFLSRFYLKVACVTLIYLSIYVLVLFTMATYGFCTIKAELLQFKFRTLLCDNYFVHMGLVV